MSDVVPSRPAALPARGIGLLGALTVLWGANWSAMKLALRELGPWTFRSICVLVGGLGLLAIARASGRPLVIARDERGPVCLVALVNISAWHLLSAYGLALIPAGRAVIIAYTMPLWAVILGRLILAEPLTRARGVALFLGLAGLAVLVGPEVGILRTTPVGALLVLGAAVAWALGTVLIKYFRWSEPVVVLTGWQLTLGAVPIVLGQLAIEAIPRPGDLSVNAVAGTVYAAVVGSLLCYYLWFRVVQLLPSAIAAIGTLGIPVVGVLASGVILAEPVGTRELAALALVVPALAIVHLGPSTPERP